MIQIKQTHFLLCIHTPVAKNCDWSRKIMSLSNLTRVSPRAGEWKLRAKAGSTNREVNAGENREFLSSEHPCEPKSLEVPLSIAGVEKTTLGKRVVAINTGGYLIWVLNNNKDFIYTG